MTYVLMLDGTPLKVADSFQRLNEAMADYPAPEQDRMTIVPDVEVLK